MTYDLIFNDQALKEYKSLSGDIQAQIKKKLLNIIETPHVPKNKLHGMKDCYKIKLRASGFRLVYSVDDAAVVVEVIVIGKRDKYDVYRIAENRV